MFTTRPKVDFNTLYPGAGEEAIDFLNKILVFNPYFRMSIDEALNHPFFKNVKKAEKEIKAEKQIIIEFERSFNLKIRI